MKRFILAELVVIVLSAFDSARVSAQTLEPPLPQGSTYYKGMVVSQLGVGVIGCDHTQVPAADGNGCLNVGSGGPFVSLTDTLLQQMNGALTLPNVNGVWAIDGVKYPVNEAGIRAALADALAAGGGTVDARNACNVSFASELDIGNGINSITLLVPNNGCTWTSTVHDGISSGFKVLFPSNVISLGSGQGGTQFGFTGAATFSGRNVFWAHANYTHISGFKITLLQGGSVSKAIGEWDLMGDNSLTDSVTVANVLGLPANVPAVAYIHNVCCNATWRNFQVEGQDSSSAPLGVGATGLIIGDNTGVEYTTDVIFDSINSVHSGNGLSNILILGARTWRIHFPSSVYLEAGFNTTNTTTPAVEIGAGAGPVDFNQINDGVDIAGSVRWTIQNDAGSSALTVKSIANDQSGNCINDLVTGVTVTAVTGPCVVAGNAYNSVTTTLTGTMFLYSKVNSNIYNNQTAIGNTSNPTPSFGPDFYGGWWNTSTGPVNSKFGHMYCVATQNNVGTTVPPSKCVVQTTNSAGIIVDAITITSGYVSAEHFVANGVPTIACGTGAGTSPTVCSVAGNDEAGEVSVTTGAAPAANAIIFTVTLANACPTTVYAVARSSNAAAAQLTGNTHDFVNGFTSNSWNLFSNTTGIAATTAYKWAYIARCN